MSSGDNVGTSVGMDLEGGWILVPGEGELGAEGLDVLSLEYGMMTLKGTGPNESNNNLWVESIAPGTRTHSMVTCDQLSVIEMLRKVEERGAEDRCPSAIGFPSQ